MHIRIKSLEVMHWTHGSVLPSVTGVSAEALDRTDTRHRAGTPGFRRVNLALFASGLATFALLYSAQPLLPLLAREYALSPAAASLGVSVATGGLAAAVLPLAALSEAYWRRRVMIVALLAAAACGLLAPFSPDWPVLLALRALEGVALAALPAAAMAYLGEEIHPGSLGLAAGMTIGGNALGGMSGRLVASVVGDAAGWRWGLAAVGVFTLACALVFWRALPPSRNFTPQPPRLGAALRVAGRHLADPALAGLFTVALLAMGAFVTVYNYLAFRLVAPPLRLSPAVVGLLFLLYVVGSVTSPLAGRLADRHGRGPVLRRGALLGAAGALLTIPDSLALVVAGLALVTAGFFAAHAVASGWVSRLAESGRAQASGLYTCAYYLGSSVGGSAGGLAYAHGWAPTAWYVAALFAFALLAGLVPERR